MSDTSRMWEQIIDLTEGRLDAEARQDVLGRIATDPDWAAAHAWSAEVLDQAARPRFAAVPADTRRRLEALLPARAKGTDELRRLITSIATLIRDVPIGAAVAGARGVGTRRQLHFDLGDATDLVLDVAAHDERVDLTGQVLGDDVVQLEFRSDSGITEVAVDDLGEFALGADALTHLSLDITFADRRALVDLSHILDLHR